MFGFSLTKLLFTVAVIAAVWIAFKMLARHLQAGPGRQEAIADTRECPACGAFVAVEGSRSCGRGDCPQG